MPFSEAGLNMICTNKTFQVIGCHYIGRLFHYFLILNILATAGIEPYTIWMLGFNSRGNGWDRTQDILNIRLFYKKRQLEQLSNTAANLTETLMWRRQTDRQTGETTHASPHSEEITLFLLWSRKLYSRFK